MYLSKNKHNYLLHCSVNNCNTVYIGCDCYINDRITIVVSEGKNVIIGDEGLFSFGIWIRTADPHLIYDGNTKKRINYSKSVLIGDHVWLGQQCLILKGTQVGSGSVLGGRTVASGKRFVSNAVYGGNPARIIKENIFFSAECVHSWTERETKKYAEMSTNKWIYTDNEWMDFEKFDLFLQQEISAKLRLEKIQDILIAKKKKNRFYIGKDDMNGLNKIEKLFQGLRRRKS